MPVNIDQVPREVLLAAVDAEAAREKERLSARYELSATLRRLTGDCWRDIRSAIGQNRLAAYDRAREVTKRHLADLDTAGTPPAGAPAGELDPRAQVLAEARKAMSSLGVDGQRISRIQNRYMERAGAAIERIALLPGEQSPADGAPPGSAATASDWEWFGPPYDDGYGHSSRNHSGNSGIFMPWYFSAPHDAITGKFMNASFMGISGAGDSDFGWTSIISEMRFWYRMPTDGLIDVWMYLEPAANEHGGDLFSPYHRGSVTDEWGWSNSDIRQKSRAYLDLSCVEDPANPTAITRRNYFQTLIDFRRQSRWSARWVGPAREPVTVHLMSAYPFPAGRWVRCGVGINDLNSFWVNDMSCELKLGQGWLLRKVACRTAS